MKNIHKEDKEYSCPYDWEVVAYHTFFFIHSLLFPTILIELPPVLGDPETVQVFASSQILVGTKTWAGSETLLQSKSFCSRIHCRAPEMLGQSSRDHSTYGVISHRVISTSSYCLLFRLTKFKFSSSCKWQKLWIQIPIERTNSVFTHLCVRMILS